MKLIQKCYLFCFSLWTYLYAPLRSLCQFLFPTPNTLGIRTKRAQKTLQMWFKKLLSTFRTRRENILKIQRFYRGYQSRHRVEVEMIQALTFYSKEVDSLELLLRRGIQVHLYDSSSQSWIESILLLNGSRDEVKLSLRFKVRSSEVSIEQAEISYLLRDIAEVSWDSPAIKLLSIHDPNEQIRSSVPPSPSVPTPTSAAPLPRKIQVKRPIVSQRPKVNKAKYGFLTIIGSSLTTPSVKLAVESRTTGFALVDSLRVVSLPLPLLLLLIHSWTPSAAG
jgi:hypothetical protein